MAEDLIAAEICVSLVMGGSYWDNNACKNGYCAA
jgi:hypothetical protein